MTSDQQAELESYRRAAREYHESVERRLADLEMADGLNMRLRILMPELEKRLDILAAHISGEKPQPLATSTSRCVVTEAQVERWERIETAAMAYRDLHSWRESPDEREYSLWDALDRALKV